MTTATTSAPISTWKRGDPIRDWRDYLSSKGILAPALALGWSAPGAGDYIEYFTVDMDGKPWITPLGQPSKRHILWNKTKNDAIRFFFSPTKPKGFTGDGQFHPMMWRTPKLWEAVKEKNGRINIFAGESDGMSALAAGIENAIAFYGEGNYPDNLPTLLKQRDVLTINYYPDNDLTGILVACSLYLMFKKAAIMGQSISIRQVPRKVGNIDIKDMNDLWVTLGEDVEEFTNANRYPEYPTDLLFATLTAYYKLDAEKGIGNLRHQLATWHQSGGLDTLRLDKSMDRVFAHWQEIDVLPATQQTFPANGTAQEHEGQLDPPSGVWLLIESAAEAYGGKPLRYDLDGWSQNIVCPFGTHQHDDKQPGFGINDKKFVWKCHKCKRSGGWIELAKAYHVEIGEFGNRGQNRPNSGLVKTYNIITPKVAKVSAVSRFVDIQTSAGRTTEMLRRWHGDPREVRGIPFGFSPKFDKMLHGLWKEPEGDLFVVLARPGNGKSTLMLQIALRLGLDMPIFVVSPEMSPDMQTLRLGCIGAGYDIHDLLAGNVRDIDKVVQTYWKLIQGRKIKFLNGGCTIQDLQGDPDNGIEGIIDHVIEQKGILIIDPIQNITGSNPTDRGWEHIETVMLALERCALSVPVLGTAQANRESSNRADKTPQWGDVGGGAAIFNHCKRMIAIQRPWLDQKVGGGRIDASPNEAIATVLKDRVTGRDGQSCDLNFGSGFGGYGFSGVGDDVYPMLEEVYG